MDFLVFYINGDKIEVLYYGLHGGSLCGARDNPVATRESYSINVRENMVLLGRRTSSVQLRPGVVPDSYQLINASEQNPTTRWNIKIVAKERICRE